MADFWHRGCCLRRMCCTSSIDISAYFMNENLHHFACIFGWEGVRKSLDFRVKNNIFISDDNVSHFRIKILAMLSEDLSKHLPLQSRVIRAKVEHVFHCFDYIAISACRRVNYLDLKALLFVHRVLFKV